MNNSWPYPPEACRCPAKITFLCLSEKPMLGAFVKKSEDCAIRGVGWNAELVHQEWEVRPSFPKWNYPEHSFLCLYTIPVILWFLRKNYLAIYKSLNCYDLWMSIISPSKKHCNFYILPHSRMNQCKCLSLDIEVLFSCAGYLWEFALLCSL